MKRIWFLLFVTALFVSSCGKDNSETHMPEPEVIVTVSEEAMPEEFQPEQIFTYEEKLSEKPSSSEAKEIRLEYSGQPVEIKGEGYTRLVGYVDGLLLIEVGGEGRLLSPGNSIGSYTISEIELNGVKLIKKEL